MKKLSCLLPVMLIFSLFVSGCHSNFTDNEDHSISSVSVTDTTQFTPSSLEEDDDDHLSQSELEELAKAAGDIPPQYSSNTTFSLENDVLTANGAPVPTNTTVLDLRNSEFSDYQFLENYKDLEELYLWDSNFSDVSVLSGLTNLKKLYLSNSAVSDVSALKCLPNLWLLDVSHTAIDFDFQDWAYKDTLEVLHIDLTETSTLADIDSLPQLRELWAGNIPATDFSGLRGLNDLESLLINATALNDLSVLSGMPNLKGLHIYETNIEDFSLITAEIFPELQTLSVSIPESQVLEIQSAYPSLNIQNFYDEE